MKTSEGSRSKSRLPLFGMAFIQGPKGASGTSLGDTFFF
jgi:hypothetical protein